MATGGDILEVTYNHPTLGTGTFFPKAGEDSTFDQGGFRSDDEANGVDGGGNMIDTMKRVRAFFQVTISNDQNTSRDAERVANLASSPVPADWTISVVNGTVWGMKGKPVGDIQPNVNAATLQLKVAGGGFMTKISG